MRGKKFSTSIYILELPFSSFIAACLSPLIYKSSLLLCEIIFERNGECIISSTDKLYYTIIFLLSFLFYTILYFQLQKKSLRNTETIISYSYWLFFCFLSGIGMALLMVAFFNYLLPVNSWLTRIYQYVHNHWGWFPEEDEENPIEGIIACISVFLCPLLFTFIFSRMMKRIIRRLK